MRRGQSFIIDTYPYLDNVDSYTSIDTKYQLGFNFIDNEALAVTYGVRGILHAPAMDYGGVSAGHLISTRIKTLGKFYLKVSYFSPWAYYVSKQVEPYLPEGYNDNRRRLSFVLTYRFF